MTNDVERTSLAADRAALLREILDAVDERVRPGETDIVQRLSPSGRPAPRVVLAGHRAAGKTRLLPLISSWCGVPGFDLDAEITERTGRTPREWIELDVSRFRALERETFAALPTPAVIAVGGGFLSLHPELLEGSTPVLVPVSFETYRERLLVDRERPRLRPALTLEEEIATVFAEREKLHASTRTWSLTDFLRATLTGGAR